MRRLLLALTFLLSLFPVAASADISSIAMPYVYNFLQSPLLPIASGNCLQTSTQGQIVGTGTVCAPAGAIYVINVGLPFNLTSNVTAYQPGANGGSGVPLPGLVLLGLPIKTLGIVCVPNNSADAANPYVSPGTNGIGGGTVTIYDYTTGSSAPTTIGTVTLPNSPAGGPYVPNALATLGSPYTVPQGDTIVYTYTSSNASFGYHKCTVVVGT